MTTKEIQARIDEILATDRVLVGTDEGTHGQPRTFRLFETIQGERVAVQKFGAGEIGRCSWDDAEQGTKGRIRMFPEARKELATLQAELKDLQKQLASNV